MYKGKKIALVIPAYNEQRLIKPTLEHIPKTIDKIYVVNDASTDNMVQVIESIMEKDKRIMLLNHTKNRGVGQAIITGYKKSAEDGYDISVVIGGDYQMDLKDLPNFLEPIINGEADYTKGNRFLYSRGIPKVMPFKRILGNSMLTLITKFASGYWKIFDTQDGYTAITREAIQKVNWSKAWKGYGYVGDWLVLFNIHNLRIKDVPRRAIYLKGERQSQIKIGRYIIKVFPRMMRQFFWRLNTKYFFQDFHPLFLLYYMSFFLIPIGAIFGIKILIDGLLGYASGNQAILTTLILVMGIQFLLFAILFDMQLNS
ncbi:glycosyltransferase family 2 protein [Candidatus Woesearchaeota archaeon]|nr:glycosyltransferase family 2 protein [Candidatus Woesearchaeota archaeon]